MLLVGDIGGTKTALAVVSRATGAHTLLAEAEFANAQYPSLEAVVRAFLAQGTWAIETAVFAVAGPVLNRQVKVTNLPWLVDAAALETALNLHAVWLLNDLEAIAYAVPILEPGDLYTLNPGSAAAGASIAVIAPGTGLGEAFLTWDGQAYRAYPSEGGHTDFGPTTDREIGLLQYLLQKMDHVSVERVCSGMGLPNLYDYLRDSGAFSESPVVAAQLATAADRTPVIVGAALQSENPCPLAAATLDMFVSILAAECSNMALKVLSRGGVYIGGGIPPRILSALGDGRFMRAFLRKGRFNALLEQMPVQVIVRQAAILGSAHYGLIQTGPGESA